MKQLLSEVLYQEAAPAVQPAHMWECGCGGVNSVSWNACTQCGRTPQEGHGRIVTAPPAAQDGLTCPRCKQLTSELEQLRQQIATLTHERDGAVIHYQKILAEAAERVGTAESQVATLTEALREVSHHADDECGFMVTVRAALAAVRGEQT